MKKIFLVLLPVVLMACCICQGEFEKVAEASLDADPDPEIIAYNGSIGGEKYTKIFIDYNNAGDSYPYKYVIFEGETMGAGYDRDEQVGIVWIDTDGDGANNLVMWVDDQNGDGFYEVVLISPP
ncbi:MAG: hypothetical protein PVF58_14935 [Candidatus Methanofastidiosia archaeon]